MERSRTVAGAGTAGFGGDNGPAVSALLNFPRGVVVDKAHNLYVADSNNNRIRRITPQGVVNTYAGTGQSGSTGDGGPATQALIQNPRGLILDSEDNLYFVEVGAKIRKITFNGIISTVAGNGSLGLSGDGGPALSASFNNVQNVTLDSNGNIFIIDQDNDRIRRVQGTAPFNAAPASLVFAYGLGSPAADQTIQLSSSDGETRTFQVTSSARWLTVSPSVGQVSEPVTLTVTANPTGLGKGTYSGQLKIESGSGSSTLVLVTMTISGTAAQLRLSKVGLTLTAVQGGSAPPKHCRCSIPVPEACHGRLLPLPLSGM